MGYQLRSQAKIHIDSKKAEYIRQKKWQSVIPLDTKILYESPLQFDIQKLLEDYDRVHQQYQPTTQYRIASKTNAKWKTINIVGSCGDLYDDSIKPFCKFKRTELCKIIPYTNSILKYFEQLGFKLERVRYSILEKSELIPWHYDAMHSCLRMHIPLNTNSNVRFVLGNQILHMENAKLYTANFNYPHFVFNGSHVDRVHLLIDAHGPMNKLFNEKSLSSTNLKLAQKKLDEYTKQINVKKRHNMEMDENKCFDTNIQYVENVNQMMKAQSMVDILNFGQKNIDAL